MLHYLFLLQLFYQIKNYVDVKGALEKLKGTAILKTRKFGYDGKGQHIIKKYSIANIKNKIEKNKYIINLTKLT